MKAILVIDKPESCTSCLLGICNKKWFCLKTLKDIDIGDRYHIPDWCPLKPMPEKKVVTVKRIEDIQSYSITEVADMISAKIILKTDEVFAFGWNTCLDSIIGNDRINEITGESE